MSQIQDKKTFARDFENNMTALRTLMKEETCLYIDFHALLDTNGQIYHLDLDRCFSNSGVKRKKKPSKSCISVLGKMERQVQKLVKIE